MDSDTHLPFRVESFENDNFSYRIRLADYVGIDGIEMPTKLIFEDSDGDMEYRRSYKFNVEYDESIFVKPPPFEAGPEAWKKKS